MGFDHPALLLLLLPLLPAVWLLHRRGRELPRVRLHAPFLLPPAARRPRGGPRDLRDRLRLLLRLLLTAGLVAALAGPEVPGPGPDRMVAVVPHGLATRLPLPDGGTRYDAALREVDRLFARARPRRALVLLAGPEPAAASGWTSPAAAVAAAARLPPGLGLPDLPGALREARRLAGPEGAIVLADPPLLRVPGNRSLVELSFRASQAEPEVGVLGVRLRTDQVDGPLELELQEESGKLPPIQVQTPRTGELLAAVSYRGPGGGPLRVGIRGDDPFPLDDEAWIRLPPLGRARVALVGEDDPELRRALGALPRVSLEVFPPSPPRSLEGVGLLVLAGQDPTPWLTVPGPPVVLIAPPAAGPLALAAAPVRLTVDPTERRIGLLALEGLLPPTLSPLPPPPAGGKVIVWAGEQPAVWSSPHGRVRLALAVAPGRAGLAGSALHAVFWDDLLEPLLLPPDGGCRTALVGERTPAGRLDRAGVYATAAGCLVARLPVAESLPPPPEEEGSALLEELELLEEPGLPGVSEAPVPVPDGPPVDTPPAPAAASPDAAASAPALGLPAARRSLASPLALLLLLLLLGEAWLAGRAAGPRRAA
ncbi:MAG: hypothetical protein RBU45_21360 [Myxococcota bacterium]|nr:hypothetical protein [Myxococcota bacterium]